MGNKKRIRKKGYTFVPEGFDEHKLLCKFKELYPVNKQKVRLTILDPEGGSPDSIITKACKHKDRTDCVYVLIDDDRCLKENNQSLVEAWGIGGKTLCQKKPSDIIPLNTKSKPPILIVSGPVAFENTILDLFSISTTATTTPKLKKDVKKKVGDDYCEKITRDMLEKCTNPVIIKLVKIFKEMETL